MASECVGNVSAYPGMTKYQFDAMKTLSTPTPEMFGRFIKVYVLVLQSLVEMREAANRMDALKRFIFYGKPDRMTPASSSKKIMEEVEKNVYAMASDLIDEWATIDPTFRNDMLNLIHAFLGHGSEAGESADILESILGHSMAHQIADAFTEAREHISEECGDKLWYVGLEALSIDRPLGIVATKNIQKLTDKAKGRYRTGQFDAEAAVNRDLDAEDSILGK